MLQRRRWSSEIAANQPCHLAGPVQSAYYRPIVATQSLLLCRDPAVLGVLRPMLDELGLGPEVCSAPDSARDLLQSRKFNPVIVDCDQMDADGELLRSLRESVTNRDSIALGIISDDAAVSDAFALGANLVIRKPVDAEEAGRILRTARALVTKMRRRFLRHVLHTLAYVHVDGLSDTPMLLDIGEGGIALQALDPLEERRAFSIRFSLPGDPEEYEAVAAAVWNDVSGRAGMRFLGLPVAARERLREWLAVHGAGGPADVSPDDVPAWDEDQVHLPVQLAPTAQAVCGAAADLLIVAAAVGVFGLVSWAITAEVPPAPAGGSAAMLLGCLCWLVYRYVFFGGLGMTPGGHVVAALADRVLVWLYNRRRYGYRYPE
jgi:CheY-like chemotaxis protein